MTSNRSLVKKLSALLLLLSSLGAPLLATAEEAINTKGARADTTNLLKFQADERRRFYDDMLAERLALQKETTTQHNEILERQRKDRREFHPENHSIDERREFFTKQREEMEKFKAQEKEELQKLIAEQKKRREEFHALQKSERRQAIGRMVKAKQ